MITPTPRLQPWSYTIGWQTQPAPPPQGARPREKSEPSASKTKPQNSLDRFIFEPSLHEQWVIPRAHLTAFGCPSDSLIELRFSTHTVKISVPKNTGEEVLQKILANCRRLITTQDQGLFPQNLPKDYPIKVAAIEIPPVEEYETR
jgi:hypothetical protein